MTSENIIARACALKPNAFEAYLEDFLNRFELRVKSDIFGISSPEYVADSLILSEEYDNIYLFFLFSVIDYLSGDFTKYKNDSAVCNEELNALAKKIHQENCPPKFKIKLA